MYPTESKSTILISFLTQLAMLILLGIAVAVYQYAEPFLIVVSILTSVFIIAFYLLIIERLMFYFWKFCTEYPELRDVFVHERVNRRIL